MISKIVAAILAAVSIAAVSARAEASYRIENVYWGNEDVAKDRIYVRDAATGKRLVLSRHWGSRCKRRAALDYGLGGGCWYPIREGYSTSHRKPRRWISSERNKPKWVSSGRHRPHSSGRKHRLNASHGLGGGSLAGPFEAIARAFLPSI
ncbi:MAG: hypothetical protein WCD20_19705 [Rhodomicrobium sp.]